MTLLSIRNLNVSIGGTQVLHDVGFDIAPGEVVGVVGESGSGKSMTALSTMRLLPRGAAMTGRILLDGEDLGARTEPGMCALRGDRLGMVFQEPMTALNPLRTIGAQVAEVIARHRPGVDAEAEAAQALTRAGLPPAQFPLTRYPHDLSGGQRQRVVIATATALRPRLLIADEPTTALDVTTQARILDLLRGLAAEDGAGLMMITHDLAVVAGIADRIVIMKDGRVEEIGETTQLFRQMRRPYTRALFEASTHKPSRHGRAPGAPVAEIDDAIRDYPLPRRGIFAKREAFRAVDHVSLAVRSGENVGLVGESGCGKSTLSRALLALEPLQGGSVRITGRDFATGDPDIRRDGLSPADAARYPHEFSGGQRQRIAIARALVTAPKLVVLDEAVSALDVSVRARILDLLADLSERLSVSYLFISHDLHVVRAITDRVMVMQAGKIVEDGATEDIFANPQHPYTRQLLAATPDLEAALAAREARAEP